MGRGGFFLGFVVLNVKVEIEEREGRGFGWW